MKKYDLYENILYKDFINKIVNTYINEDIDIIINFIKKGDDVNN